MAGVRDQGLSRGWPGLASPCPVCRQWSTAQPCEACLTRFQPPRHRCPRCAIVVSTPDQTCGRCLLHPPAFSGTVTGLDYAFPWDRLIGAFKFGADLSLLPALTRPLERALQRAAPAEAPPVDLVLAMPLAPSRLRERGFNQCALVARRVAVARGLPCPPTLLRRWRDTPHQTGLHRDERMRKLRGAFMPEPGQRGHLRGRHVALVDDVMTTGASAEAASLALLEGGAARVSLWLLARTPETPA